MPPHVTTGTFSTYGMFPASSRRLVKGVMSASLYLLYGTKRRAINPGVYTGGIMYKNY